MREPEGCEECGGFAEVDPDLHALGCSQLDRYWNSELSRWIYPTNDSDSPEYWERRYLEVVVRLDALRMAIEDLSDWYLQKDAVAPASVTSTLGIANDLQSLLHDPSDYPPAKPAGHLYCDGCHVEP